MKNIAGLFLLVTIVCSGIIAISLRSCEQAEQQSKERFKQECQKLFNGEIADIKLGKTKSISMYGFSDTDFLLKQAANVPEIELIELQMTDISDEGIRFISSLPKLNGLVVYCGNVTDQGFASITKIKSLESLVLISTGISDRSLEDMKELPNLHSLILAPPDGAKSNLNDAGLMHLKKLTKLKKLNLCGGWASETTVEELRKALPDCDITTNIGYSL